MTGASVDQPTMSRAFIVSNGRCGSTMLSDLIARHPHTLSAQEFMVPLANEKFEQRVTGETYWHVMSSPTSVHQILTGLGIRTHEERYPDDGRWGGDLGNLPRILEVTLPAASSQPDDLFDLLAEEVPRFPTQSVAEHNLAFLDLLATKTGHRRWVERSGASTLMFPKLLRAYPTAKFVYLTRNIEANARSMSRHAVFQLSSLQIDFLVKRYADISFDEFSENFEEFLEDNLNFTRELRHLLPQDLSAEMLEERSKQLDRFIFLCSFMNNIAEKAIIGVPPRNLLKLTYEQLVANPVGQLRRLGRFLDFEDWQDWAEEVAPQIEVRY
jgi:putative sulfotransferase